MNVPWQMLSLYAQAHANAYEYAQACACPPDSLVGRAVVGRVLVGPPWALAPWIPWALVGPLGPCGRPWTLVGPPGPLWAEPLWTVCWGRSPYGGVCRGVSPYGEGLRGWDPLQGWYVGEAPPTGRVKGL